jgi:hypothetical protein
VLKQDKTGWDEVLVLYSTCAAQCQRMCMFSIRQAKGSVRHCCGRGRYARYRDFHSRKEGARQIHTSNLMIRTYNLDIKSAIL